MSRSGSSERTMPPPAAAAATDGSTGPGEAPSFAAVVPQGPPPFPPVEPAYTTVDARRLAPLSSRNAPRCLHKKVLERASLAAAARPSPHSPPSGEWSAGSGLASPIRRHGLASEVDDLEPLVSTTPNPLINIEQLSLSNSKQMESPTSPASPYPRLQLPVPNQNSLGVTVSATDYLDRFVSKFVDRAMEEFMLSGDVDDSEPDFELQAKTFAKYALEYYNGSENNKVKYELVEAKKSCYIMEDGIGLYGHVNFIARAKDDGSEPEDQLFFAELRQEKDNMVLIYFHCLTGKNQIGGVDGDEAPTCEKIDMDHCYACSNDIMHPKDGMSYMAGHFTTRGYYDSF